MKATHKYDWDAISADFGNGMPKKEIVDKYQISISVLTATLSQKYKHLLPPKNKKPTTEKKVKIQPLKPLNMQCPIIKKIEIIKLLNKKIPHHQIAMQLNIDILQLKKIIHKIKIRVKNA